MSVYYHVLSLVHGSSVLHAAVDCGILVAPLFGSVVTTRGSTFRSVATYSCDVGHVLAGIANRMCQESAEWTGFEAPLCVRKYQKITERKLGVDLTQTPPPGPTYYH